MNTSNKQMILNKAGCAALLVSAGLATNAMAVNFVATNTATLQANAIFSAVDPGHVAALTGPALLVPGTYTVVAPLNVAGTFIRASITGGLPGSVVPTASSGPLLQQQAPIPGQPNTYSGLTTTGRVLEVATMGSKVLPTVASPRWGLSYANFGSWQKGGSRLTTTGPLVVQMFAGGTAPTLAMPLTGSAIYTGKVGIYGVNAARQQYEGNANIRLTAAFGPKLVNGAISAATVINQTTQLPAGTFNPLALNGTFTGNAFSGSVTTLAGPAVGLANPLAMAAGVRGTTSGKFYGPTANEITGTFALGSTTKVIGAFGAKR